MRQQSTTLVLTLSAAVAAFTGAALSATIGPLLTAGVPWVVVLYSLLGVVVWKMAALGEGLSLKHYERNKLHVARARQYRKRLLRLFSDSDYEQVNAEADKDHKAEWERDILNPFIVESRLHQYWVDIFKFIRYLGLTMVLIPLALAVAFTRDLTNLAIRALDAMRGLL
jgi:hypothetical protein